MDAKVRKLTAAVPPKPAEAEEAEESAETIPPQTVRCPRCGTWDIRTSQQQKPVLDAIMRMFQRNPRRCRVCGLRFYAPGTSGPAGDDE